MECTDPGFTKTGSIPSFLDQYLTPVSGTFANTILNLQKLATLIQAAITSLVCTSPVRGNRQSSIGIASTCCTIWGKCYDLLIFREIEFLSLPSKLLRWLPMFPVLSPSVGFCRNSLHKDQGTTKDLPSWSGSLLLPVFPTQPFEALPASSVSELPSFHHGSHLYMHHIPPSNAPNSILIYLIALQPRLPRPLLPLLLLLACSTITYICIIFCMSLHRADSITVSHLTVQ